MAVAVDDLSLSLGIGDPAPIVVTVASADLSFTSAGLVAEIADATLTSNVPGVEFSGAVDVSVDTTNPASKFVRVEVSGVDDDTPASAGYRGVEQLARQDDGVALGQ